MKTFFFKKPPILYSYEISCTCVITYPYLSKLLYIFLWLFCWREKIIPILISLYLKKSWKKTSPIKRKMSSHLYQNFILWKKKKNWLFPLFDTGKQKNCRYKEKEKYFLNWKTKLSRNRLEKTLFTESYICIKYYKFILIFSWLMKNKNFS